MTPWQRRLFERTRDDSFLLRGTLLILGSGLLVAILASFLPSSFHAPSSAHFISYLEEKREEEALPLFKEMLLNDSEDFPSLLEDLSTLAEYRDSLTPQALQRAAEIISSLHIEPSDINILQAYWQTLLSPQQEPGEDLLDIAKRDPPVRFANYALGTIWLSLDHEGEAFEAYKREALLPEAEESREWVVAFLLHTKNIPRLTALSQDPLYQDAFTPYILFELASQTHDWATVWQLMIPAQYDGIPFGLFFIAGLAALVWFAFATQAAQVPLQDTSRLALYTTAVIAGILSTYVTIFGYICEEEFLHFEERSDLIGGFIYFILGVGLTEEFFKLLFFVPFLPFLLRKRSELDILMIAACVGLGFAAEENLGYYHQGAADTAGARFLTANFLHMATTGLCGLALARAFLYQGGFHHFLSTFITMILIHGAYDAFLSLPDLQEISAFYLTVYVFLCLRFFGQIGDLRRPGHHIISLRCTFAFGLSTLCAVTLVWFSLELGVIDAILDLGLSIVGLGIIAYMFMRELQNF